MISAISSSLSGLQSASQRLNVAANTIVNAGSSGPENGNGDSAKINPARQSGAPVRASYNPPSELVSGVVDLKLAEVSYKASLKALKIALDTEKSLLDQIG